MKQRYFLFLTFLISSLSWGQTSSQDFGNAVNSMEGGTSTTLYPGPTGSGTIYNSVGSGGGGIYLSNTSNPLGSHVSGSFIIAVAPTSTSVNKFTPILDYIPSKVFYTSFKVLFGNSTAGNTGATSGFWGFHQGDGANFSNNSNYSTAQGFMALSFGFIADGKISVSTRISGNWTSLGFELNQGQVYTIQIVGNNSINSIDYTFDAVNQSVVPNKYDLYIDGVLVANDTSKSGIADDTNIDSIMFVGTSSTSNVANIFVDNVTVYNSIPSNVLNVVKNDITGFALYPNPVKGGKVFISSANNYAERTVQVFDVLGKQVVNQKGTQNSVDVSHLNKGIYIMKVAEEGKVATRKLVIE